MFLNINVLWPCLAVSLGVTYMQLEPLRKKVADLEQAILAKDRENVTNRSMYDNMKGVSRKIKEVSQIPPSTPPPRVA